MSYTVKYTDTTKDPIIVNDSTINTETSLALPGRNQRGYGIAVAESFLHLLENFANTTAPSNPIEGQVWYDTTTGVEDLKVYDGTTWKSSGSVRKSSSTPTVGILGDLWVDTDNQQLYLFNGASWVLVGPTFSSGLRTGVVAETVVDSNDLTKVVLKTYINDEVVAIYSVVSFIPKVAIQGFSSIKSGMNLSTKDFDNDGVVDTKYWGTAEKAENLIVGTTVVASSNFLRKDTSNITNFGFTVRNDQGISTGAESQLRISVDAAQTGNIYHSTPDSQFDIRINYGGEVTTIIRSDSSGNVGIGINNLTPAYTLDVLGNSRFTDVVKIESTENSINDVTGALQILGGTNIQKDLIVRGNTNLSGIITVGNTDSSASAAILPRSDNLYDLGYQNASDLTDRLRFRNVYASTFYGDLVGNISGNINGTSGAANRLTAGTTFQMTGQVTADSFTFDGSTGGTLKTFETKISATFIDDQEVEFSDVNGSDEFLVYRSGTGQLGKMMRTTFFQQVATVPVGTVLPFAGANPPLGYLLCDGSEKSRATYPELFAVIGYTYGDPSFLSGTATFRMPDLRGRFMLGRSSMDNADSVQSLSGLIDSNTQAINPSSQATEETAGVLGNTGGMSTKSLSVQNIPTHKHNLTGDNNTDFYVTNNNTGIPNDTGAFVGNGPSAVNEGQYLPNTGEMINASLNPENPTEFLVTPFNIMNPYLTMNYIIYTGKFE
jgi:microcystin-dependent protein